MLKVNLDLEAMSNKESQNSVGGESRQSDLLSDIEPKENDNKIKWLDNSDNEVEEIFGFNKNAELVNSRAAMIGFLMMVLTELAFKGKAVTSAIFGIN